MELTSTGLVTDLTLADSKPAAAPVPPEPLRPAAFQVQACKSAATDSTFMERIIEQIAAQERAGNAELAADLRDLVSFLDQLTSPRNPLRVGAVILYGFEQRQSPEAIAAAMKLPVDSESIAVARQMGQNYQLAGDRERANVIAGALPRFEEIAMSQFQRPQRPASVAFVKLFYAETLLDWLREIQVTGAHGVVLLLELTAAAAQQSGDKLFADAIEEIRRMMNHL